MLSIPVILGLAISLDLEIEQLDVKVTFLLGGLEEKIYVELPNGFGVICKENLVYQFQKSLYSLKQALQWYKKFSFFMAKHDFKKILTEHYTFVKRYDGSHFIVLLLYVNGMLIVGHDLKKFLL